MPTRLEFADWTSTTCSEDADLTNCRDESQNSNKLQGQKSNITQITGTKTTLAQITGMKIKIH
jgi:hypothetical protein